MPNNEDQKQLLNYLMGQLSAGDREKLEGLLADKAETERLLKTPEAQQLLRKIQGGK
ncbi:MAG: hypothetical protein GX424_11150 [Clostridiales bacterium]|jgi:anti-sigma factor RsiW|nr:hypothetical protein [Clostridiales bacterium]